MSLVAPFVDGELVTNTSQIAKKETKTSASANSMDKEAFLQLLVAQMKYQDPLQPTSNTEYISQYATFSELEQMQNMSANMTLSRASEMVGKEVIVESTSDSGKTTTVQGQVESVSYQGNKAYVSIDGTLYSVDDVVQIVDDEYQAGVEAISTINKELEKKYASPIKVTFKSRVKRRIKNIIKSVARAIRGGYKHNKDDGLLFVFHI